MYKKCYLIFMLKFRTLHLLNKSNKVMKRALILLSVLFLYDISYSQSSKTTQYDSLSNFLGKDVYQYIGQTFYLNENGYSKENGYRGFHTKAFWDRSNKKFIYKPFKADRSKSDYNTLKGKCFKVIDVIESSEKNGFGVPYCLKLLEIDSQEIAYFQYDLFSDNFPFIVLGYFEKLKQLYIGVVICFQNRTFGI